MGAPVVLVAYASETGSTARIAGEIASELRAAGLGVDCRLAADVGPLDRYAALVLGSGVYVRSRHSDGGGFLSRHAGDLGARPVWLFTSGPIGRGRGDAATTADGVSTVVDVAHAIGAQGAAAFGCGVDRLDDDLSEPVDMTRVRGWAREIAAGLRANPRQVVTA